MPQVLFWKSPSSTLGWPPAHTGAWGCSCRAAGLTRARPSAPFSSLCPWMAEDPLLYQQLCLDPPPVALALPSQQGTARQCHQAAPWALLGASPQSQGCPRSFCCPLAWPCPTDTRGPARRAGPCGYPGQLQTAVPPDRLPGQQDRLPRLLSQQQPALGTARCPSAAEGRWPLSLGHSVLPGLSPGPAMSCSSTPRERFPRAPAGAQKSPCSPCRRYGREIPSGRLGTQPALAKPSPGSGTCGGQRCLSPAGCGDTRGWHGGVCAAQGVPVAGHTPVTGCPVQELRSLHSKGHLSHSVRMSFGRALPCPCPTVPLGGAGDSGSGGHTPCWQECQSSHFQGRKVELTCDRDIPAGGRSLP